MERKFRWKLAVIIFGVMFVSVGMHSSSLAKEVKIGACVDLTGPIAHAAQSLWKGMQDYFKWAEKNDPIPGVTVKLLMEDTRYDATRYIPVYKKFLSKGIVAGYNCSSTATVTTHKFVARAKLPVLSEGSGFPPSIVPPAYTFLTRPLYPDFFAVAAIHFMEGWKKAGHKEKPKAVFITWDVPYGRGPIDLGTPWAEKYGFEMLPPQLYSKPPKDLSTQLLRAKKLGADLVYMNALEDHYSVLLKDAKRLGLHGKIQFCGGSETRDNMVIKMVGDAAEGAWAVTSWPDFAETSDKGTGFMTEIQTKTHGKLYELSSNYFMGLVPARIIYESIKLAAKKYGPENVTKEAVYNTLISLKNLDMKGICPDVNFSETERRPFLSMNLSKVQNGKWVREKYNIKTPGLKP